MLDCHFFGLNAHGHHATNVVLHAATAGLLLLVLRQMTDRAWPSTLAAALFAIHPLRVESVAWVAERKDVLSGLFFMLTLAAYVGYARRPFSLGRYLLAIGLYALGLMAKPMLVTLPLLMLLLDYWPLGRFRAIGSNATSPPSNEGASAGGTNRRETPLGRPSSCWRLILEKLPFLALTVVSCLVTVWAQGEEVWSVDRLPLRCRIDNALVSYVAYLGQLFWPRGLVAFYPHPGTTLPVWKVAGAAVVLAGISAAALAGWRRRPYLLVGWLWCVGMLAPVIGLTQTGLQGMADRFTYLPQIGLDIALVWGASDLCRSWPHRRRLLSMAATLLLAVLMGCAWRQTCFWHDSEALWLHALACTSQNYVAHNNYGLSLAARRHVDEALA